MALDFDRFKGSANSFGTQYVDGLFKPSISYRANAKFDQDVTNQIVERMNTRPAPYVDLNKERSLLDRGFDALLLPNYAVAGAFDGAVRKDRGILEGAWEGIKAGNPFGKGFEEGETTFSDVLRSGLERGGYEAPTSFLGKATVGTAGFVLDVLLDPTTYMTFGTSALIKGTGKLGKAANAIEGLAKANPQFADGLREAGELTDELAEEIVMKANGINSFDEIADSAKSLASGADDAIGKKISREQFLQEVTELKTTYNKLLGVGRTGQGITIGVKNMPFGDFVAKKLNIKSEPKMLIKDDAIRAFSDKTGISSAYQASRNAFYGGKVGQLLSRNAGLKKLAEADPAKLYEYIGTLNKLRGKDLDKVARETLIKQYSESLLGLTPAEQKKIIKALENPSFWKQADEIVKGTGTPTFDKIQEEYKQANESLKGEIARASEILSEYKDASVQELSHFKQELSKLQKMERLEPNQARVLSELNDEINSLMAKKSELASNASQATDYTKVINDLEEEVGNLTNARAERLATAQSENVYRSMAPDELNPMLDNHIARINELDGMKAMDGKEGTNIALNKQAEVTALRKLVSEIIYGNPDVLSPGISRGRVISLANAIKAGDDGEAFMKALSGEGGGYNFTGNFSNAREVEHYYESNPDIYDVLKNIVQSGTLMSDEMKEVYSYIATKYGYKSIKEVRDRVKDTEKKLKLRPGGQLSRPLANDVEEAMFSAYKSDLAMLSARSKDLAEIAKVGDSKAQALYVRKLQEQELREEMYQVLYGDTDNKAIADRIVGDLSDTREQPDYAGTKYNAKDNIEDMRYAEEARHWGDSVVASEKLEIEHMRFAKSDKKYAYHDVVEHSRESIKTTLLKNRRKALLKRRLSPEANIMLTKLNERATKLNELKANFHRFQDKAQFKKQYDTAMEQYKILRDEAERTTNLFKVSKQVDELSPTDVKTLSAQLEASTYLQYKVFPYHKYDDLTTKQKGLVTGLGFAITKEFIKENGIPTQKNIGKFHKYIEQKGEGVIKKNAEVVAKKRAEEGHSMNVASKVSYGSGIEFKAGGEVKRGVVASMQEDFEIITRKEVEIKYTSPQISEDEFRFIDEPQFDKKTGKPIINKRTGKQITRRVMKPVTPPQKTRNEIHKEVQTKKPLGSYTYQVETPDGVVSVKASDIVGTYNHSIDEIGTRIPKFIEDEVARIDEVINDLKARIVSAKDAKALEGGKVAEDLRIKEEVIDKQLAELTARKLEEESMLGNYSKLVDEQKELMVNLFGVHTGATKATREVVEMVDEVIEEVVEIPAQAQKPLGRPDTLKRNVKFLDDVVKKYTHEGKLDSVIKNAKEALDSYKRRHSKLEMLSPDDISKLPSYLDRVEIERLISVTKKFLDGSVTDDMRKDAFNRGIPGNARQRGEYLADLEFLNKNYDLVKQLSDSGSAVKSAPTTKTIRKTVKKPVVRIEEYEIPGTATGELPTAQDIAKRNEDLISRMEKKFDDMVERQAKLEKALDDNEMFEQLVKLDLGDEAYMKLVEESAQTIKSQDKLAIDLMTDWDENLKMHAKAIRQSFREAGLDEVAVGKLDAGAFETMADKYFPRTLSEEGKKFFDDNPEYADKYLSPTNSFGFGKAFNEHVLRRNDELRDRGLKEVNDYFESKVGVRIFEENLGKAYLNRMMTSNEMVYDQRTMFDLMHRFGHRIEADNVINEGYKAVVNYGEVKARVRQDVMARIKMEFDGRPIPPEQYKELSTKYAQEILEDAGLDVRILDGETVPLIELAQNQIEGVKRIFGDNFARQVNSLTVDRANQIRKFTMQRDEHKALQLYDKFMTFFKLNQTTVMPSFHVRNHLGAMFVGWLGVGREALSFKAQKRAYDALKLYGKDMELRKLGAVVSDDGTKVWRYDEILQHAEIHGVIDEGFMMKDFSAHGYSDGTRILPGKFDPFNTKQFAPYKIGSKIATYSDNINRITQFTALLKQGKTPAEASDIVRHYMFDYSDLTSFEMNFMKRIFPYYTYMRKNLPMMTNEFLDNPEKLQMVAKLSNLPEGMVNDEDKIAEHEKLGFAQDWLQMPFGLNSGSGNEPILFNPNMPYMQLRDINVEGNIGEQARTLFSQSAPMIKVPIELATNWNSFFDDSIVKEDGEQISPKIAHVLSQLAGFNAVKQFVDAKTMDDKVLSLLNTTTGVKMTTYDIEGAKEKVREEAYNREFELTVKNILGSGVGVAKGLIDNTQAKMGEYAVKLAGKPYDAFDEVGVYAPVSDRTYEEMSEDERKLYSFDTETKAYVHQRALEFEREQYEETGIFKKFLWTIVESNEQAKEIARVERVTDGDTFVASQGDKQFNVRLLLVDTPESKGDYKDNPQAYAEEASQYTTDLILVKDVKLYLDEKTTYGRRLAFVEVAGQSVQESLLQEGYGKVRQYDTNYTEYGDELYNIEEEAYKSGEGVWSQPGNAVPRSNTGFVR